MFFSTFLTGKDDPLGRLWLASYNKSLKRQDIDAASIPADVGMHPRGKRSHHDAVAQWCSCTQLRRGRLVYTLGRMPVYGCGVAACAPGVECAELKLVDNVNDIVSVEYREVNRNKRPGMVGRYVPAVVAR
jgi:hypothetical protein